ncbi:MAG TPA: PilZ domain-containing protein [Gemmataceae bacterium]|jgi:hypothetical protein|nr:PilZ domain-containing protein [Gemmataceae bacterium]
MTPDPSPPPGGPPNRRRWQRWPVGKIQAERIPDDERPPWQVAVRNFSQGGIRLVLGNELATGTVLSLRLSRPGRASVLVPAHVVYVLEKPAGNFITGCAFDRQLTDEELRRLL